MLAKLTEITDSRLAPSMKHTAKRAPQFPAAIELSGWIESARRDGRAQASLPVESASQ